MTTITCESDRALPLVQLKHWLSDESYQWIEESDIEEATFQEELDQANVVDLFGDNEDSETPVVPRVQTWRSSSRCVDGHGGVVRPLGVPDHSPPDSRADVDAVSAIYVLSESWDGFGDTLWASARHAANLLANPDKCLRLIGEAFSDSSPLPSPGGPPSHPLMGVTIVELGAGAGLPSWTAMRCGAHVVSTDMKVPNRIRCLAECAQRNWMDMQDKAASNAQDLLTHARKTRVCGHDWGTSVEDVIALNQGDRFDVVVAADCCYMTGYHPELLESIDRLMHSDHGVCLMTYALHGNVSDDDVMAIEGRARGKGFAVEKLASQQLTPPKPGMSKKQGMVYTLKFTRPGKE